MFSISKTERSQDFIKHQIFLPHEEIRSPHSKEKGSNFHKDSLNLSLANVSVLNFRSMNKMYNPILLTIVFKLSKINLSSAMRSQNWNMWFHFSLLVWRILIQGLWLTKSFFSLFSKIFHSFRVEDWLMWVDH